MSIEWSGYLMPTVSGAYLFRVEADDGIKVTIGETVVIDSMVVVSSGT